MSPIMNHPRKPALGRAFTTLGQILCVIAISGFAWRAVSSFTHARAAFQGVNERRDGGFEIPSTVYSIGFMLILGLGSVAIRKGKRLSANRAEDVLRDDTRPPILLLRAFVDDELIAESPKKNWDNSEFFAADRTLEEAVCEPLSRIGPVIAIGRPGEKMAPAGAAREYLSNDAWQGSVLKWLDQAKLVVMVMGPLVRQDGLKWELSRIADGGYLPKLILVVPPLTLKAAAERWTQYRDFFGGSLPLHAGGEMLVTFDSSLAPQVFKVQEKKLLKNQGREKLYKAAINDIVKRLDLDASSSV